MVIHIGLIFLWFLFGCCVLLLYCEKYPKNTLLKRLICLFFGPVILALLLIWWIGWIFWVFGKLILTGDAS